MAPLDTIVDDNELLVYKKSNGKTMGMYKPLLQALGRFFLASEHAIANSSVRTDTYVARLMEEVVS